ncbi:RNA polymerase sigma factor [Nannocystis pusilla]|uniref:Sigma-70 family RNA polymerase sigma factor n=1 Tax=Nannocystis pusilla TaxID=889268 RepID=A0ABS7TU64_9BACT|nr:sigma-70 family RNA polymerase sigma factor [Nannocystis pusilla]MBZ5711692.1 sigma-70 family RNA polymerase sigma factor [Nannocystis pusilla]
MSEPSDWELAAAWRDRQPGAGDALISRHYREMSRFFCNKVASGDDAADLVHQTFLGALESLPQFRGETSFRRYLYAVARNVLHGYIRKRYKREREHLDFSAVCVDDLAPASPSSIIMSRRQAQALVDALRQLPLHDQVVLELRYFSGLTSRESALLLAVAEPTLRSQLARGKERLRAAVAARLAASPIATPVSVSLADLEAWAAEIRAQQGWKPAGPLADGT